MDVVEYQLPQWLLTGAMLVATASVVGVAVALYLNKGRVALLLIVVFVVALGVGLVNALMSPS